MEIKFICEKSADGCPFNQEETEMRRMTQAMAAVLVAATMLGAGISLASTPPILVDSDARSSHWATVFTNEVPLVWDWNTNAVKASLAIEGMEGTFTTNFVTATTSYLWQAFATSQPSEEDAYTLTLTFYTNSAMTQVVEAQTSRLAVVTGAFGAVAVNPVATGSAWAKVRNNSVIPYDASWTEAAAANAVFAQLVIGNAGQSRTNAFSDLAGYTGLKIKNNGWGYGEFNLLLSFPGTAGSLTATLFRPADGTMIRMQ
jgi:hypothetical protein